MLATLAALCFKEDQKFFRNPSSKDFCDKQPLSNP